MNDVLVACLYTPCFLIYLALAVQGIRRLRDDNVTLPFWTRLLVPRSKVLSKTPAKIYQVMQIISRIIFLAGIILAISQSNLWILVGAGFISALVQVAGLGYLYIVFRDDFVVVKQDVVRGDIIVPADDDQKSLPPSNE